MTNPTCADRIGAEMQDRASYVKDLMKRADALEDEQDREEAMTELDELPLAITLVKRIKIELSTGGPADWLEAELDGREVRNVEYHFADWFDHADIDVPQDSPLWAYAEQVAELFDDGSSI